MGMRTRVTINESGVRDAGNALTRQAAEAVNRVIAEVAATHSGRPVDVVLNELVTRIKSPSLNPNPEGLRPAAEAISAGEAPPLFDPPPAR